MKLNISITLLLLGLALTSLTAQLKEVEFGDSKKVNNIKKVESPTGQSIIENESPQKEFSFSSIKASQGLLDYNSLKQSKVFKDGYYLSNHSATKSNKPHQQISQEIFVELMEKLDYSSQNIEFKIVSEALDKRISHYRYQQEYKGIPVYFGMTSLHIPSQGMAYLSGEILDIEKDFSIIANVSQSEIHSIVQDNFGDLDKTWTDNQKKFIKEEFDPKLTIYHLYGEARLAYEISYHPDVTKQRKLIIDAQDGSILKSHISTCNFKGHDHSHSHDEEEHHPNVVDGPAVASVATLLNETVNLNTYEVGTNYYLIDGIRDMFSFSSVLPNDPEGVIWTIDAFNTAPQNNNFSYDHISSSNNTWGNAGTGVTAHHHAAKAYEYFKNTFFRESINGAGGNIVSLINIADEDGSSLGNAFWNGVAMFYGNGDGSFFPLARALDVAGHEMSHGVIQNTANLEYFGESGALNESIADIFGAMIDRDNWSIGEDVVRSSAFPTGALRNLQNPNQGLPTNDFGRGWQPMHMDQKFNGPEDNNGVHINSGIPNHAFYLIATEIGKDKAESLVYQSLTRHLTRSSQFIDFRNAMIMSANELFADTEANAVRNAFAQVGIGEGEGTQIEQDVEQNPGDDLVIFTDANFNDIYINDPIGGPTDNQLLSNSNPISKPSLTDDASQIYFINEDGRMHRITLNFVDGTLQETVVQSDPVWRNVIISKDGTRLAALMDERVNEIWVFDFGLNEWNIFDLYNPTFTEGVSTGEVLFADAMEFDFTGNYIMYDANNNITSTNGSSIEYWDVGFIEVWNETANTWNNGTVEKLFAALPEDVSIGNPAFSKNSPYIIAFDFFDGTDYELLSANIERGDVGLIFENNGLSFPSFSTDDTNLIFDFPNNGTVDLGIIDLASDKLSPIPNTAFLLVENARWGTWAADGDRDLTTSTDDQLLLEDIRVFPNPVEDLLTIEGDLSNYGELQLKDLNGITVITQKLNNIEQVSLNTQGLANGMYFLQLSGNDKVSSKAIIKL